MKPEELYAILQKKTATDADFRKRFIKAPNAVLAEISGEKIPDDYKIKVIESDPAYSATFVLPDLVGEEVSDDDLDAVAGGLSAFLIVSVCGVATLG